MLQMVQFCSPDNLYKQNWENNAVPKYLQLDDPVFVSYPTITSRIIVLIVVPPKFGKRKQNKKNNAAKKVCVALSYL